ncbi:hypothetical protein AMECASPLE_000713 [Ameca splendens]|uniref:Uncharacterized protein n=3 Tax=Goodeidae TaxID=28758 RepID=A0ABU7BCD8_9TELE|nr:hypothetical protein [Ataeniobius toweri]MED6289280.1 hypothetical protein [Characodon lateralis]
MSPVTSLSAFLPSDAAWSCFSGRTRTASKPGDKSNKVNPPPDQSNVSHLTVYEPNPSDPTVRVNSCVKRSGNKL